MPKKLCFSRKETSCESEFRGWSIEGIISWARPVANYGAFLRTISSGPDIGSHFAAGSFHLVAHLCLANILHLWEEPFLSKFSGVSPRMFVSACVCASACVTRACAALAEWQWCQTHNDFLLAVSPWGPTTCYRSDQLAFTPLINTEAYMRTQACARTKAYTLLPALV